MGSEEIVRAELDAWNRLDVDEALRYFAADAVWEDVPLEPIVGYDAIRRRAEYLAEHWASGEIEILKLVADGGVVLTERIDRFLFDGVMVVARVMGAFEVSADKITAWRDYYDLGQTRRDATSAPA
jgi:limonene-1,2-epoxide hydrolase